jgi:hypothetical protein
MDELEAMDELEVMAELGSSQGSLKFAKVSHRHSAVTAV